MRALYLALTIALSAGASASAQPLEWRAGAAGGGWFTVVTGTAKLLEEKNPGMTVKVVAGAGATNPTAVEDGQAQLGMSIDIFAAMARGGTGVFEGKPKHEKLMMIGQSLGDTPFHFIRAKGQTLGMGMLLTQGKNIRFGAAKVGATDEIVFRWIMAHFGQTYDSLKARGWQFTLADFNQLASEYKEGKLDYMFFAQGLPAASVIDMANSRDGELVSVTDRLLKIMKSKHGMSGGVIPAGTYPKFQSIGTTVLTMKTTLVTSSDVAEDAVYRITKTLCENEADLPRIHASLKDFKCATAVSDRPVPVHPGALRYYREKGLVKN